jgi:hypothetical protein
VVAAARAGRVIRVGPGEGLRSCSEVKGAWAAKEGAEGGGPAGGAGGASFGLTVWDARVVADGLGILVGQGGAGGTGGKEGDAAAGDSGKAGLPGHDKARFGQVLAGLEEREAQAEPAAAERAGTVEAPSEWLS